MLFTLLPLIFSFKGNFPKLCIHCKHFLTDYNTDKFSKCSLFPKKDDTFLVNGIQENKVVQYFHCTTARSISYMCGVEGKKYEFNDPPN
jgi:hypothetical protein